jgi:hypothetical protein
MESEKFIGWLILILGIFMIVYPLFLSYNIFIGKNQPPILFNNSPRNESNTGNQIPSETQKEVENMIKERLADIFSVDFFPRILNLISWSVFVGILIFAGSQISNLGINLIKS